VKQVCRVKLLLLFPVFGKPKSYFHYESGKESEEKEQFFVHPVQVQFLNGFCLLLIGPSRRKLILERPFSDCSEQFSRAFVSATPEEIGKKELVSL
jgi:hypothetical protein